MRGMAFFSLMPNSPLTAYLHALSTSVLTLVLPPICAAEAAAAASSSWSSENKSDLGTLWLRMLRFYALELSDSDAVVSIRHREVVTRADKGWNSKKIAIEGTATGACVYSSSVS